MVEPAIWDWDQRAEAVRIALVPFSAITRGCVVRDPTLSIGDAFLLQAWVLALLVEALLATGAL